MKEKNALIHIRNLNVFTRDRVLVKGIDLDLYPGDMLGVAGESGSGKTMTVRAILGILPEGVECSMDEFIMFGKDCRKMSSTERRRLVGEKGGFIPQNTVFYLHPMMKIRNQMIDSYLAHKKGTRRQGLRRAAQLLEAVGLEDTERILNSYAWELSGGMRQRVNIAMALMNGPDVLIADEPTTALDAAIQKQIMDLFETINKETGIAVIMVSHNLSMLEQYSHRTMVMYAGRSVESGSTEAVFSSPAHPYTRALMKVVPDLDHGRDTRLEEIPGYVPDSGRDSEECTFAPRCPMRSDRCTGKVPLVPLEDGRECLCFCAKGGKANE